MPVAAGVALALAACNSPAKTSSSQGGPGAATTAQSGPPPKISATPAAGATGVSATQPVSISVSNASLKGVVVVSSTGQVPGAAGESANDWKTTGALTPGTTYHVHVDVGGAAGAGQNWQFTTAGPGKVFKAQISPDGQTVGVGMPIVVHLSKSVSQDRRAALEDRFTVSSTPAVIGAWHWFSPTEMHWRPSEFWPAHADVKVAVNLEGFDAGDGAWGVKTVSTHFNTGDAHINVVNVHTHEMVVTSNGAHVKTVPVSTGRPGDSTHGGTHVISEKEQSTIMTGPGYSIQTFWNARISDSGEFVHSAPWSVGSQGSSNVSHGCVNVSPSNAQWFYKYSMVGDVVRVDGSPVTLQPENGYGDWQIPWSEWPSRPRANAVPSGRF